MKCVIKKRYFAVSLVLLGGFWILGPNKVRAATVYNVPPTIKDDCSVDVTSDLQTWFASVPDNSTLVFGQNKCYDIDEGLVVADRNNLIFDGQESTFKFLTKSPAGMNSTAIEQRANWRIKGGSNITLENMIARGANPDAGVYDDAYDRTVEAQHGFSFEGTQTALLDNVQVYDIWGDFVEAEPDWRVPFPGSPVTNLTVKNSHFDGNGRMGFGLTHIDGFILEDSYVGDVRWSAIDLELDDDREVGKNITITRNEFGPIMHYMFTAQGAGLTGQVGDVTITNNVMDKQLENCLDVIAFNAPGVATRTWSNWTITGNTLRPHFGARAVNSFDAANVSIQNNTIDYGGAQISGCGQTAPVNLVNTHTVTYTDNTIYGPYTSDSSVDSLSDGVVDSGNSISLGTAQMVAKLATPVAGATVSNNVVITPNFLNTVGITSIRYRVDKTYISPLFAKGMPSSFTWNSTTVANGVHTLDAEVYAYATLMYTPGIAIKVNNVAAPADTTAPTISLTTPASGTTVSGSSVALTANATDNVGVVGVQFKVDGVNYGAELTLSPYIRVLDTTQLSNGTHKITATARDAAANIGTSAPISITVNNAQPPTPDTTAPTISITAPLANATVSGPAVALSVDAADNIGVAGVQYKIDDNDLGVEITNAPFSKILDSTLLTNGVHVLTVVARDAAGNIKTSAAVSITIFNSPVTSGSGGGGSGSTVPPSDVGTPAVPSNPTTPPLTTPSQPSSSSSQVRLVNDNGTYFLIQGGERRGVTNPGMLWSQGLDFKDAVAATPDDEALPQGPNLTPRGGSLVKTAQDKTVYFISNNQKHGFTSEQVFLGQGFKWSSILTVTQPELDQLSQGSIINDANAVHLPGTDVQIDSTIYWIGPEGSLHPYPSLEIYNSWHRQNDFSTVVPANQGDRGITNSDAVVGRVVR